MYLLPFAERLLWFSSALSSFPGQVPTHEVSSAAEGNVPAVTPTSAIICCAESMPSPGTSASRITASWWGFIASAIRLFSLAICSSSNCCRSSWSASICRCMGCDLPVKASTSCSLVHFNRSSPSNASLSASVSPLARAWRIRRPLDPNKSVTSADSLIRISSRRHSI